MAITEHFDLPVLDWIAENLHNPMLAGLIAFSRLYLYVHYPTDVLFSLVLSVPIALAAVWLVEKADHRIKAKRNK